MQPLQMQEEIGGLFNDVPHTESPIQPPLHSMSGSRGDPGNEALPQELHASELPNPGTAPQQSSTTEHSSKEHVIQHCVKSSSESSSDFPSMHSVTLLRSRSPDRQGRPGSRAGQRSRQQSLTTSTSESTGSSGRRPPTQHPAPNSQARHRGTPPLPSAKSSQSPRQLPCHADKSLTRRQQTNFLHSHRSCSTSSSSDQVESKRPSKPAQSRAGHERPVQSFLQDFQRKAALAAEDLSPQRVASNFWGVQLRKYGGRF